MMSPKEKLFVGLKKCNLWIEPQKRETIISGFSTIVNIMSFHTREILLIKMKIK
jgi:hypothetical protein